jgi:uncharacterized protein YdeI (YjbR/CyaY-like superfamily)
MSSTLPSSTNAVPEFFSNPGEFRTWLEINHAAVSELWLGFYKKNSGKTGITYEQALDEALCFGWIDGLIKTHDEFSYRQRFTPRKARSSWSKTNVGHVERLLKEGRMAPSGLSQVQAAQADGRWEAAYSGQKIIAVPGDLRNFLDSHPRENVFFEKLNSANRYAILYRLETARKPETRTKRLALIQKMLTEEKVFHSP